MNDKIETVDEILNRLKAYDDIKREREELLDILRKLLEIIPEPECHISTMTPCPKDSPLMREWEKYNQSDEYANSFKWAAHQEHRKGSMWAAFMAGFLALRHEYHGDKAMAGGFKDKIKSLQNERDALIQKLDAWEEIAEHHDRIMEELEDVYEERDQLRYTLCNFLGISVMESSDAIITQAKEATK